jgi:hypothetical protein
MCLAKSPAGAPGFADALFLLHRLKPIIVGKSE